MLAVALTSKDGRPFGIMQNWKLSQAPKLYQVMLSRGKQVTYW